MSVDSDPRALAPPDGWSRLRSLTSARIALGRSGASLPTREVLALSLAHSQARDAVMHPLDVARLEQDARVLEHPIVVGGSQAEDRSQYLVRPDLGRRLRGDDDALPTLEHPSDLVFVLSDGLSATALQSHAVPLLEALWPRIVAQTKAPLVIATQARVALSDEIGARLRARITVCLIGERPGLSAPDSLGIYLTYGPRVGNTDEARNCISNVRPSGLGYAEAADMVATLIFAALSAGKSGVALQGAVAAIADDTAPPSSIVTPDVFHVPPGR